MVRHKAGYGAEGAKVSAQVLEFLEQQQQQHQQAAPPPEPPRAAIASSGFVPRTEETDRAKESSRTYDASDVLKVGEDDAQVKIYNTYAKGANTTAEGVNTKRGLGLGSEGGRSSGPPGKRFMSFVSAGGAPAATAAARPEGMSAAATTGAATTAAAATAAAAAATATAAAPSSWPPLPPGWTVGTDPTTGHPYYANPSTGETSWTPPPPPLPQGWINAIDPTSGRPYFYHQASGVTQWEAPSSAPPPPPPPPVPYPQPVAPAPNPQPGYAAAPYPQPGYGAYGAYGASSAPPAPSHGALGGGAVRVHGLPAAMGEAEVKELFSDSGRILRVELDRGAYSGGSQPKAATVTFDAKASAEVAIKTLHGKQMRQATLTVELLR